jgi:hypothetical protein
MKIKASYKEGKEERLKRIALNKTVKTQVIPNKKGYTRKPKHKEPPIPENEDN